MKINQERLIRNRFALLIGVNEYVDTSFQSLQQTKNDVKSLNNLLLQLGYKVRILHCQKQDPRSRPTKKNICHKLEKICGEVGDGDLLLVHFGGHGALENEKAFLVPSDASKENLEESAIELEEFKKRIIQSAAQAKILFLDACHAGIERREGAGMSPGFERHIFLEAEGTATLAACMRHQEAWNYGGNGVFTHYILEGLNGKAAKKDKRFITFDDLKYYVTDKVKTWAESHGRIQTPSHSSQLVGDPPLVELESKPVIVSPPPAPSDNPFTDTLAICKPERFIGRKTETRRLRNLLKDGSVTLKGEPKIGKSSMLWNLAQTWPGKKIGPINFDSLSSPDDFYKEIARSLKLENHNWNVICRTLENLETLLLLDELDSAPKRGITHDDMSHFRAVCESNKGFKIVAVSRAPLKQVFPDTGIGSPFYNILQPLTLEKMNREDALSLLEHPWAPEASKFAPAAYEELLVISQYHPFKLQRAAYHYYEGLGDSNYRWKDAFQQDMEQML